MRNANSSVKSRLNMKVLFLFSLVAAQYNRDFNLRDLFLLSKSNQLTLDEFKQPNTIYEENQRIKPLTGSAEYQNTKTEYFNESPLFKELLKISPEVYLF